MYKENHLIVIKMLIYQADLIFLKAYATNNKTLKYMT